MLLKPKESNADHHDVNYAHVCKQWYKVKVQLLVQLEVQDIDTRVVQFVFQATVHDATYEFSPVTVPALTPKKNESMAERFP